MFVLNHVPVAVTSSAQGDQLVSGPSVSVYSTRYRLPGRDGGPAGNDDAVGQVQPVVQPVTRQVDPRRARIVQLKPVVEVPVRRVGQRALVVRPPSTQASTTHPVAPFNLNDVCSAPSPGSPSAQTSNRCPLVMTAPAGNAHSVRLV